MCLQVNQQYVQVQAIVSQVSSLKPYKKLEFEYVTQRGKTSYLGPKNCKLACEVKKGKHKLLTCMTYLGPKTACAVKKGKHKLWTCMT